MSEEFYPPLSSPDRSTLQQEDAQQEAFVIDDPLLLERLRQGDEETFVSLVQRYHGPMLRLVMIYIPNRFLAEEVVQEAWLGVLQSLKNFEGRSSLKTWIFRILTNRMKTRLQREGRSAPFSSFSNMDDEASEVEGGDPDWFLPPGSSMVPGRGLWISLPPNWNDIPEEHLLSQETQACISNAINALSPQQRQVILLRDLAGWGAQEVCDVLTMSEGNQRVLLHRARSHVRHALEDYFYEGKEI
jgi:RNA polymerase sigma-70 factor (ECF subfamily)